MTRISERIRRLCGLPVARPFDWWEECPELRMPCHVRMVWPREEPLAVYPERPWP